MFAAHQAVFDSERDKRLVLAAGAAVLVLAGFIAVTAVLSARAAGTPKERSVDVSFRPPPPPPPPAKIDNPPPPPPKRVATPKPPPTPVAIEVPVPTPAPAPAAAAMVAPKELPKEAPPESATPVAAIAVAVGGKGDGSGAGTGEASQPSEDDSPAPVEVKAAASGPVNLPEEADPPEPDENNAPPEYPEAMRATGHEARVVLKVVVQKDGTVGRIQVLKGEEPFTAAAIAAVKTWRFSPATLDGQPLAVFLTIPVKFSLRE